MDIAECIIKTTIVGLYHDYYVLYSLTGAS